METFLLFLCYSILSYGWWWIAFVGIAFCAARYTTSPGLNIAFLIVAFLVFRADAAWKQAEMRNPGTVGTADLDGPFIIGALARILIVSIVLTPVAITGLMLRKRSRSAPRPSTE